MKVDFIGFFVSMASRLTVQPTSHSHTPCTSSIFVELLLHRRDNRGDGTQTTKQPNNQTKQPNNQTTKNETTKQPNNETEQPNRQINKNQPTKRLKTASTFSWMLVGPRQSFFFGCQLLGYVSRAVRPSVSYNNAFFFEQCCARHYNCGSQEAVLK